MDEPAPWILVVSLAVLSPAGAPGAATDESPWPDETALLADVAIGGGTALDSLNAVILVRKGDSALLARRIRSPPRSTRRIGTVPCSADEERGPRQHPRERVRARCRRRPALLEDVVAGEARRRFPLSRAGGRSPRSGGACRSRGWRGATSSYPFHTRKRCPRRVLGPWNAATQQAVLVIGNRFDPATRYQGAQTVRGLLSNSSLLTLNGWGHVSLFLSGLLDAAVADYLLTGVAPADGTVYAPDWVPFGGTLPAGTSSTAGLAARQFRARLMPDVVVSGVK